MHNHNNYSSVASALGAECSFVLVTYANAVAIHDSMISEYGGTSGVRDAHLLRSAVGRQLHTISYGANASISSIAASLAFGVAQNHAFLDGNKRTAFGCMIAFCDANGIALDYDPVEAHQVFIELAAGRISEQEMAEWISRIMASNDPAPSV